MPEIAIVLNAHREGWYLHTALASVAAAAGHAAEQSGLAVSVHVVLDRPDDITREIAASSPSLAADVIEVDFGDLALSRAAGIDRADAPYVALMDGDDLWGDEWLCRAHQAAVAHGGEAIWHPDINLMFGADPNVLFVHPDSEDDSFDSFDLIDHNHWTSLSFGPREVYLRYPFHPLHLARGRGFEDWSWNCRTLAAGVPHKVVPQTVHFVRRRPGSLSKLSESLGILPEPTDLFRRALAS